MKSHPFGPMGWPASPVLANGDGQPPPNGKKIDLGYLLPPLDES